VRVLVAGATGAVGRALVPELVRRGHVVGGLARNPRDVRAMGGEPLTAEGLDRNAVHATLQAFKPDVIVHQLTALPKNGSLWRFDSAFSQTNRLRTEGTDILLDAARLVGAKRFVAQSFCGWPAARTGGWVKNEDDPLDPCPPSQMRSTLDSVRYLERTVAEAADLRGTILRYGSFYGPGTHLARDGPMAEQVRKRLLPIIGSGAGTWSFCHILDVAEATAIAAETSAGGVYNVVDDDPAPVMEWLPYLAATMAAKPPLRVPAWVARIALPEHLRVMMTEARGGSNSRFKARFDWQPRFPSWKVGFKDEFG
jgi:2-alkyl-3-oxoalkanoate reductase